MKSVLVCCVLLFAVAYSNPLSDATKKVLNEAQTTCESETGVTNEMVQKAKAGETGNEDKLGKHFLCLAKKIGIVTEDGKPIREAMKEQLMAEVGDEGKVDGAIKECVVEQENPETTALFVTKCFYAKFGEL